MYRNLCIWIGLLLASVAAGQDRDDLSGRELKLTALMASRVATNETSFRWQCDRSMTKSRCVNDLVAILQRTEHMARVHGVSMYEELRMHSPRATGRCLESNPPDRCARPLDGNAIWSSVLRFDLRETEEWRRAHPTLPWRLRRPVFENTLRVAMAWLSDPWYTCERPPMTWGGVMDVPRSFHESVDCGPTRNTFYARAGRQLDRSRPIPANIAKGRSFRSP